MLKLVYICRVYLYTFMIKINKKIIKIKYAVWLFLNCLTFAAHNAMFKQVSMGMFSLHTSGRLYQSGIKHISHLSSSQ